MESRTKNTSRNIFWGIFNKLVAIGMPFVTRTVMIYQLGIEYTGIHSLFTSLLSVLSLAELGFGSALVFSMYEPIANGDTDKVCALLNFYKKCYRIIGCVVLTIGLLLLPFLDYLVAGDVPTDINLRIIYLINLANTVISYVLFAYKNSLFTACQRLDVSNRILSVLNFVTGILQIGALVLLHSYYVYALIVPVVSVIHNLLIGYFSQKMYPQYVCRGKLPQKDLAVIKEKVTGLSFFKIGSVVLTSVDTLVISAFLGLTVLGIYNGYYYIVTALFGFLTVIQQSMTPSIGNSIVKESKEKNYEDFRMFQFIYIWLISWCCTCLICLYQPFIRIWQGQDNMLGFTIVILLGISFFAQRMADIANVYREAVGLWWQAKFIPLISALVNLTLNILLVQVIGLPGVALSTIISVVLIYTPGSSLVIFRYYFCDIPKWKKYMKTLLGNTVVCAVITTLTYAVCTLVGDTGILALLLRGVICLFLPNVLFIAAYHRTADFQNSREFIYDRFLVRFFSKIKK